MSTEKTDYQNKRMDDLEKQIQRNNDKIRDLYEKYNTLVKEIAEQSVIHRWVERFIWLILVVGLAALGIKNGI